MELIEQIARALAEYAEQACRYVAKHNSVNQEDGPYRDGFETACEVCEAAILPNALRHIDRINTEIRPIIQAAIAAERERCAVIADQHARDAWKIGDAEGQNGACSSGRNYGARAIASAIRSQP